MTEAQWAVLIGNIAVVALQSYLFRWQRSALMFCRRLQAEYGMVPGSHMAFVPPWQVTLAWPIMLSKWAAWIALWFFFSWYVPALFIVAGFLLTAIHSATTTGRGHEAFFQARMNQDM